MVLLSSFCSREESTNTIELLTMLLFLLCTNSRSEASESGKMSDIEEKLRKKKEEEEAMWGEYIEQRKRQRQKEEEELKKLKERQGKRKTQRAEQEKLLIEMKRKQEEQKQREIEEKKNREVSPLDQHDDQWLTKQWLTGRSEAKATRRSRAKETSHDGSDGKAEATGYS